MENISPAQRFTAHRDQVSWRMLDGEAVLIHLETTHYYSLNATGTFLWQLLLEGQHSVEDLVQALAAHFEVEPDEVRGDARALVAELQKEGLIHHG